MTSSRYLRAASGHPAIFFATFAISPFCLEQQEKTPVVSSQMLEGDIKMGGERRGVGYGPGGVVGSNIQSRVVCYGKEFLQLPACVLLTRPHSFPDSALLCTFGRGLQMADSALALARGAPYRFEEELGRLGRHAGRLCFGFGCGVVTCAFSFLPSFFSLLFGKLHLPSSRPLRFVHLHTFADASACILAERRYLSQAGPGRSGVLS